MEIEEQKGQDTATFSESEGYIADDETRPDTTTLDHHGHGGFKNQSLGEDPEKFFSKKGGPLQEEAENADAPAPAPAPAAPLMKFDQEMLPAPTEKGVESSELGTGYEADGEETIKPDVVPKYNEGVKVPSFGGSDVDSGYEEGSEGSLSHTRNLSDFSVKEEKQAVH